MTGLSRHFQSLDTTGDGTLDKDELKEALKQFNIQIPVEVVRRWFGVKNTLFILMMLYLSFF